MNFKLVSNGNPDIAIGQQSTTTLSIFDNETANISFDKVEYTTLEYDPDNPQLAITLTRTGRLDNYADVTIQLGNGTATEGEDFFGGMFPQNVSFSPWETSKTIYLDFFDDGILEGTETLELNLVTDPFLNDVSLGEYSSTTVSILDNQTSYLEFAQANYIASEDSENPTNQLEITVTRTGNINEFANAEIQIINGTAFEGQDFYANPTVYFNPGETTATIYVDIIDDPEQEGTRNF